MPKIALSYISFKKELFILPSILFFLLSLSHTAQAAYGVCWLSSPTLNFGQVSNKGATNTTTLQASCTHSNKKKIYVTMCFSFAKDIYIEGAYNSTRQMIGNKWPFSYLKYDLFLDAALLNRIDYSSLQNCISDSLDYGEYNKTISYPIYGKVYAGQNVPTDNYSSYYLPMSVSYRFSSKKPPSIKDVSSKSYTNGNVFKVQAAYENSCSFVSIPDLNFGQVSDLNGTTTGSTTITFSCPTQTAWQVSLDHGVNYDGHTNRMKNGAYYIPYQLYQDSQHTKPWDNLNYSQGVGENGAQHISIYGSVPPQMEAIPAGEYTDTITVKVTY